MRVLMSMFLFAEGPAWLGRSSIPCKFADGSGLEAGSRAVTGAGGGDTTPEATGMSSSSSSNAGQSCSHSECSEKSDCQADLGLGERGKSLRSRVLAAASEGRRVRGWGRAARSGSNKRRRGFGSRCKICAALAYSLGSSH
jgi:hypothetical protein